MRYKEAFSNFRKKNEKALVPFVVIGDPDYKTSLQIVKTIVNAGADILELGFAFSDPLADGPTIQAAGIRAINDGINTEKNFSFIKDIRDLTDIPIGILVYANLVYQRGIDNFYRDAHSAGADSILIADVPIEEAKPYLTAAKKNNIDTVFIISQLTKGKRLKNIIRKTTGFLYLVSRLGVTGARKDIKKSTLTLIRAIRKETHKPLCVGFGISKPEHVKAVLRASADGVIIGSSLVNLIEDNLENKKKMLEKIRNYVLVMKRATKS